MAKLDRRTRRQILASLCEGVSIRSCERIFDVEQNSVAKLLADAGDMAITLMKRTKGLMVETIQADELYSFVGAKQVNVDRMTVPVEGAGTVWGYLAVCAKSKLIFNYHLGDRSYPHARAFMQSTADKLLRENAGGPFVVRPKIITDGLTSYVDAVGDVFGSYADHGVYKKRYQTKGKDGQTLQRKRCVGAEQGVKGATIEALDHLRDRRLQAETGDHLIVVLEGDRPKPRVGVVDHDDPIAFVGQTRLGVGFHRLEPGRCR